ncbi:MAG: cation transporter [Alphaproteobacteria bacterium]
MAGCAHDHEFAGASPTYKRALYAVIGINLALAIGETAAGAAAGSMALLADALDFWADSATYAISLWAIGHSVRTRATVAMVKGISLALMAAAVLSLSIWRAFDGTPPHAEIMQGTAIAAFLANALSVLILVRWKDGDANVRSVWLCSRNDMIGNVAVLIAGIAVFYTNSAAPDLVAAFLMAGLFLRSSIQIITQARGELAGIAAPHSHAC